MESLELPLDTSLSARLRSDERKDCPAFHPKTLARDRCGRSSTGAVRLASRRELATIEDRLTALGARRAEEGVVEGSEQYLAKHDIASGPKLESVAAAW